MIEFSATVFSDGSYYRCKGDELETAAKKAGVSMNTYCSLLDQLMRILSVDHRGACDDFDSHDVIARLVKTVRSDKGE